MKIKINDKEIELTPEQVKILGEEVKKEKKGLWKPGMGEEYYWVDVSGDSGLSYWADDICDRNRYSIGNVFKTEEEARAYVQRLKAIQRVKEYIAENCEPFYADFNEFSQKEKDTYFESRKTNLLNSGVVEVPIAKLALTTEDANKIAANCEADLKIIWGIK